MLIRLKSYDQKNEDHFEHQKNKKATSDYGAIPQVDPSFTLASRDTSLRGRARKKSLQHMVPKRPLSAPNSPSTFRNTSLRTNKQINSSVDTERAEKVIMQQKSQSTRKIKKYQQECAPSPYQDRLRSKSLGNAPSIACQHNLSIADELQFMSSAIPYHLLACMLSSQSRISAEKPFKNRRKRNVRFRPKFIRTCDGAPNLKDLAHPTKNPSQITVDASPLPHHVNCIVKCMTLDKSKMLQVQPTSMTSELYKKVLEAFFLP